MKIFRVVTERSGYVVKAPGVSESEIIRVDRRYAAETMEEVWAAIYDILRNNEEEDLIAIIEEFPSVTILNDHDRCAG